MGGTKEVAPDYPKGPFSQGMAIGSYTSGGNFISTNQVKVNNTWQLTGHVVKTFIAWTDGKALTAVRVTYTDGRSDIYGQMKGSSTEYNFETGEAVTVFKLWGNGIGTRCGRVEFTTNRGRTFAAGRDVTGQTAYVHPNVGSGIVAGIYGKSGNEIDCLGFVFLEAVESVTVQNLDLQSDWKQGNLVSVQLDKATFPLDEDWTLADDAEVSETREISMSSTFRFGVEANFEVSVPLLAGANETISWDLSVSIGTTRTWANKKTLHWSVGHQADNTKRDQMVEITALSKRGTLQGVPFTSDVVIRFRNGSVYSYKERGLLASTVYSDTYITRKLIPAPPASQT